MSTTPHICAACPAWVHSPQKLCATCQATPPPDVVPFNKLPTEDSRSQLQAVQELHWPALLQVPDASRARKPSGAAMHGAPVAVPQMEAHARMKTAPVPNIAPEAAAAFLEPVPHSRSAGQAGFSGVSGPACHPHAGQHNASVAHPGPSSSAGHIAVDAAWQLPHTSRSAPSARMRTRSQAPRTNAANAAQSPSMSATTATTRRKRSKAGELTEPQSYKNKSRPTRRLAP